MKRTLIALALALTISCSNDVGRYKKFDSTTILDTKSGKLYIIKVGSDSITSGIVDVPNTRYEEVTKEIKD